MNSDPDISNYYRIRSDDDEFQLLYSKIGIRKICYIIDRTGKECASIYVDEYSDDANNNTAELLLSKVVYKPICSIDKIMMRGMSTIHMLRALMTFAIKMIPKYPYIVFMDDSHFTCDVLDMEYDTEISLAHFSFLLYGKTWYERHFNAILDEGDIDRRLQLENANMILNMPIDETFVSFWRSVVRIDAPLRKQSWYIDAKNQIEYIYNQFMSDHKSRRDFFLHIFDKRNLGENVGCTLYSIMEPGIKQKFGIPELNQTHWKIPRATILTYPEYQLDIRPNASPIHIKKSETYSKLSFMNEYMMHVGGKTRRYGRHIKKKVPLGCGGIVQFIDRNYTNKRQCTRRLRK